MCQFKAQITIYTEEHLKTKHEKIRGWVDSSASMQVLSRVLATLRGTRVDHLSLLESE